MYLDSLDVFETKTGENFVMLNNVHKCSELSYHHSIKHKLSELSLSIDR